MLVRHPQGDVLVDTGVGRHVEAQLDSLPRAFRWVSDIELGTPVADQLDRVGYDRSRLRGVLLTHAHWDHVSGLPDLGGTPALVSEVEKRWLDEEPVLASVANGLTGVRWETYGFESGPLLGFPRSNDLYGDGSIVAVPCPGHTPGSVIVFITLPTGRRVAFVGDLVWQLEGITRREERPWITRFLADDDPNGVRAGISEMAALRAGVPDLVVVPAHDPRGFTTLETM